MLSPKPSIDSISSASSISASNASGVEDPIIVLDSARAFYQKVTNVTGRRIEVKDPKRGQKPYVFQKITKTTEISIENCESPQSIMIIPKDQTDGVPAAQPNESAPQAKRKAQSAPPDTDAAAKQRCFDAVDRVFKDCRASQAKAKAIAGLGPARTRRRRRSVFDPDHPLRKVIIISSEEEEEEEAVETLSLEGREIIVEGDSDGASSSQTPIAEGASGSA